MLKTPFALLTALTLTAGAANAEDAGTKKSNLIRDYDGLVELLKTDKARFKTMPAAKLVGIEVKKGMIDGRMVIRWDERRGLIRFVQVLPVKISADRVQVIESALSRLNSKLAMPAFCFDYKRGVVYYQITMPTRNGRGLEAAEIRAYFNACLKNAAQFCPGIKKIAAGDADASSILDGVKYK